MDELDHKLISSLRGNARMTVAALAKQLQVARGTVQNRIARVVRFSVLLFFCYNLLSFVGPVLWTLRAAAAATRTNAPISTAASALRVLIQPSTGERTG